MRWLRSISTIALTLLVIEFLDELVFGAREAAWPLIRDDLQLSYLQVGLVLGIPGIFGSVFEPIIGILGDVWKRRVLIFGGGIVYAVALLFVALSQNFLGLLLAICLLYPASGAFVSLSQAVLMDAEPDRHEQNMARWTFAGSLGIVIGPIFLGVFAFLGWSWRGLFLIFSLLAIGITFWSWRISALGVNTEKQEGGQPLTFGSFWRGLVDALRALKRGKVVRWLVLLQFANLMLDILHGFLALYFVDIVELQPKQAALAVAVWTGAGLVGDFLLIPLLEFVSGLKYLRLSAIFVLGIYPAFLLVDNWIGKLILIGILGILNAGWYAIPKGQLYSAMPGQSGSVMTLNNIFGLIGTLIPLGMGWLASVLGLDLAIWFVLLGPMVLILGIPRFRSKIKVEEKSS